MGCDIHEYFEIRDSGIWTYTELLPFIDWDTATFQEEEVFFQHPALILRNYALFSMLANVRNKFSIKPFALPRDIPDDASEVVRLAWQEGRELWEHDTSWLTLEELLSFDWNQTIDDYYGEKSVPYGAAVDRFVTVTLPYPKTLVADPADLRMIFWFDN